MLWFLAASETCDQVFCLLSFLLFFEERGENIKTLHLIYFVRPCYYFPNPMGFYRFLSAPRGPPSIEKNRKQQEHAQWMTVNETKVIFAEKTCHKNLLPGLQIPYKFFPKSFLMLFTAIFRLRNIQFWAGNGACLAVRIFCFCVSH